MYSYCFMGYEPATELNERMNELHRSNFIDIFSFDRCRHRASLQLRSRETMLYVIMAVVLPSGE